VGGGKAAVSGSLHEYLVYLPGSRAVPQPRADMAGELVGTILRGQHRYRHQTPHLERKSLAGPNHAVGKFRGETILLFGESVTARLAFCDVLFAQDLAPQRHAF